MGARDLARAARTTQTRSLASPRQMLELTRLDNRNQ